MSALRTLVVCPGRGSYDRNSLGYLSSRGGPVADLVAACDRFRAERGRPTLTELDGAKAYRVARHVAGEHASLLTFACSLADFFELDREQYDVVGIAGNSMGWYTALAASGALPLTDAIRLVDTLGQYQEANVIGGQILYPLADPAWRPSAELREAVERGLDRARDAGHAAAWSIELGGVAVLGADRDGVKFLLQELPAVTRGPRTFPLQLPLHSAFHTPLMQGTAERAQAELADLAFGAPRVPLFDGRGQLFRPRIADPRALAAYTLGHQIVEPYDFTTSIRAALRYTGAEVVVCLGPGNPLGGPVARIVVDEGWGGLRDRAAFEAASASAPPVRSFGIEAHRSQLLA